MRQALGEINRELPLFNVRTLTEHIEANLIFRRVPARLFAVLGPMLLVLAAIGIYAVVAYTVSLRTTELGVRLAVGATPRRLIRECIADSFGVILAGAVIGWVLAFAVAIVMTREGALDLAVFAGVPLVLLAVAAVACWLPARRAGRVEPVAALRCE
jgi:ABC-type antimicrobial peptide transport system permease subunit